jgi:hypothetical protein
VLAVHAYGYGLSPDADVDANAGLNLARLGAVRGILAEAGDSRPVWVTELGYTVDSGNHPVVSENDQARYLVSAVRRVRREWPWVELLTIWNLSAGGLPGDEMAGFSLLKPDGSPRLAYAALRGLLRPTPEVGP